jgi:beta-lactam-binding protein with PASTA domain
MTLREQLERLLRLTLLVFVLAAAAFLSAITTMRVAIRGRVVTMPNLVGKPVSDAQRVLGASGLQIRVADRMYSPTPLNTVVRQSPSAGEQVKVSQDVQVVLSMGPQKITIPPLEGRSLRAARVALLEVGLPLGEVSTVYLPDTEPDMVLKQDPPAGQTAVSPRVDVLVAEDQSPAFYVMPSLVGMEQGDAERILAADGLHVSKINNVADSGSPKGTVIGQTPSHGARIASDATVELNIAE